MERLGQGFGGKLDANQNKAIPFAHCRKLGGTSIVVIQPSAHRSKRIG
jgi:hypothetical protein